MTDRLTRRQFSRDQLAAMARHLIDTRDAKGITFMRGEIYFNVPGQTWGRVHARVSYDVLAAEMGMQPELLLVDPGVQP